MIGRGERIRTSDSCVPNAVLYQAELHPESSGADKPPAHASAAAFRFLIAPCNCKVRELYQSLSVISVA